MFPGEPMMISPQKDLHNSIAASGNAGTANAFNAKENFIALSNMIGKVRDLYTVESGYNKFKETGKNMTL